VRFHPKMDHLLEVENTQGGSIEFSLSKFKDDSHAVRPRLQDFESRINHAICLAFHRWLAVTLVETIVAIFGTLSYSIYKIVKNFMWMFLEGTFDQFGFSFASSSSSLGLS
jgi:hypothetical protein